MRSRSGFEPADESFAFLTFHLNISNASYLCYRIVNPNGDVIVRQTYDYTDTRPKLKMDEAGQIVVAGGARRYMQDDLPAGEMPVSAPVSTNAPARPSD